MIIFEDKDCLSITQLPIKISCDNNQAMSCVIKVVDIANKNIHNINEKNQLIYPSNGDYIHEIALSYKKGKIFACINLFDIIYGEICVSDNGETYGYENGEIVKLVMGVCGEKSFNEIITKYEKLKRI